MYRSMMTSKKSLLKPARPPPPNTGVTKGGINLSGFSFKQLEEDDNGEDLTAFTGKYQKPMEETQKIKKSNEKSLSTTSLEDASQKIEKKSNELDSTKHAQKVFSSEASSSPLRSAARAKFDSSKELFSGLKGKITDKISRTIEEFSGESSNSPSPDKERFKTFPMPRSNSFGVIEKEDVPVLHSTLPLKKPLPEGLTKKVALDSSQNHQSTFSLDDGDGDVDVKKRPDLPPETFSSKEVRIAEDHPLAQTELDDTFEDVIEVPGNVPYMQSKPNACDEFKDVQSDDSNIEVYEEHFTNEPAEDFTTFPGIQTSTKPKSRSKISRLIKKKEQKTSAIAAMSSLHSMLDEEIVSPSANKSIKQNETDLLSTEKSAKDLPKGQESTPNMIFRQISLDIAGVPYQRLASFMVVMFAYFIIPLPPYISGLLLGIFLSSLGWALYMWLIQPPAPNEPYVPPPVVDLPLPEMKLKSDIEEYSYKGWMNELTDYNPEDYHINKTHSVFISLEGPHLRLQRPKNSIPKRAMFDEVLPKPQFIHQRHYDLPGSIVYLLPPGLVEKRIWSKKYPICISLPVKVASDVSKLKHISSDTTMSGKKDKHSEMGFEIVTEEKCDGNILFLFARTCREKEEWFKRFTAAANGKPLGNHILELKRAVSQNSGKKSQEVARHKREGSTDSVSSLTELSPDTAKKDSESENLLTFAHYMGRLMPAGSLSPSGSPTHSATDKETLLKNSSAKDLTKNKDTEDPKAASPSVETSCECQLYWLNALIGRCFFDFLRDKTWMEKVKEKLQRKLSKIHVPYFIEELKVTDIQLGYEMPTIKHADKPYLDERGLWIDLDITYSGGFKMTIETKINLMKLKVSPHMSSLSGNSVDHADHVKSAITDAEEEDSAESSTDEEEESPSASEDSSGGGTSKKLLRYLNKITQSKYFHKATEYSVIKRAMENVSNTPLTLTVSMNSLNGKLALNIPPPPTDRLWYGFRGNPHLRLSAKPQVGERAVTIVHVTDWIEKKLAIEFQRVFVMPNMDDLIIPILVPGQINGTTLSRSVSL
ncbi:Tabersonine 6,7-epoxidase isoform 2 [Bulinus truncatus]|nr:Tabersonine 6,7-epoxidase isoform 2 [Bulinus truncatus]